ncbi:MAG: ABC transporter permease [Actinobacteria bacterium]|nr:ABC transporter permease [Actinomycetota bacterium]
MKEINKNITIIQSRGHNKQYFADLWKYRELFYFLSWRDILVRYKQTVIGIAWSIIRPVLTMIIFTIIFGKIAKLPSDNVPYPILVFVALLPWQFFANALQASSGSLVGNAGMISKVYFPRMIIPASSIIVAFIDFLISFIILIILMFWYRFMPDWRVVTIPLFLILAIFLTLGTGLFISSLNVKYRDFQYIVPFIIQLGLYISPVGFSSDIISKKWKIIYSLNPMVGIIDGFRWAFFATRSSYLLLSVIFSIIISISILFIGVWYFRKTERTFADRI